MQLLLVLSLLSSPALADSIDAVWTSPLGALKVTEDKGLVKMRSRGGGACKLKAGTLVFEGARIDDTITGTLTTCARGPGCGKVSGIALFTVTPDGRGLTGITHLEPRPGCSTPVQEELRLLRRADPVDAPEESFARRTAKARAQEAVHYFKTGGFGRARALALDAFLLDPTWGQAANLVGATYAAEKKWESAEEWYARALHIDPTNHDTYYNLASAHAARGKKALAVSYLKIAVVNGFRGDAWKKDEDFRSLEGFPAFEALKRGEL
jgi:hypothetical protein